MNADRDGMQPFLQKWGRQIAGARRMRGMSQLELAQRVRKDVSTISRIERGVLSPSDEMKWRLSGVLQEPWSYLFPSPDVVPSVPEEVAS